MVNTCIFCQADGAAPTVEHIWPESLGGGEEMILAKGFMCRTCNNYFGREVEKRALESYPFSVIRAFYGIPSKKGKHHGVRVISGTVTGPANPPFISLEPANERMVKGIASGQITSMTIPRDPHEPLAICRLLLKMGIQLLTDIDKHRAFDARFDAARRFARSPKPGDQWWFALDDRDWGRELLAGADRREPAVELSITLLEEVDDAEFIRVQAHGMLLFAPLVPWFFLPDGAKDGQHDLRFFEAEVRTSS